MDPKRNCLTALAIILLSAGPALALQDPPASQSERIENFTELESFSATSLVAELIHIGELAQGRIAIRDPEGLTDRLQAGDDRLTALAAADGGRSGLSFEINFSTDGPTPTPCDDASPVIVVARQGIEIDGTLCRIVTKVDDVPVLMFDQQLRAPFDGHTIYIHLVTSMVAESDELRDAGGEILSAMANDVLRSLILASPADIGEDWEQWRGLLQVLTDRARGFIRFEAPDAVAQRLLAASAEVQRQGEVQDPDWGFTFNINGEQSVTDDGILDPDRLGDAAGPATPAWCQSETPITIAGPSGTVRSWQACQGTPPGEDPETLVFRKIWFEETLPGANSWLEISVIGSTGTPAERFALDVLCEEVLSILARNVLVGVEALPPRQD
jgi:hypothetical protein